MSRRVLFLQGESRLLNPTLDQDLIDAAYEDDAESARSEWGGLFRSDVSQFLPDDVLDRALCREMRSRPRMVEHEYCGFVDPSGAVKDRMTMAIAHRELGRVVLDKVVYETPPFKPEDVVLRFCEVFNAYGLSEVTGDAYGAEWVASAFLKHGVTYTKSQHDKSAIYNEVVPLFTQGLVDLVDLPLLETELRLLERYPRSGGKSDRVDHPPRGGTDDVANAVCGALLLASKSTNQARNIPHAEPRNRRNGDYDPYQRFEEEQRRLYGDRY